MFLGAACAPFAEPRHERARRIAKKASAGAEYVISQHVFEPDAFRRFVADLDEQGTLAHLRVLGAVAVLPSAEVAHGLNRVLTGFVIPEPTVRRLEQARDQLDCGLDIAAELLAEIRSIPGVAGSLVGVLGGGAGHVMRGSAAEDAEIQREVLRRAGLLRAADRAMRPQLVARRSVPSARA